MCLFSLTAPPSVRSVSLLLFTYRPSSSAVAPAASRCLPSVAMSMGVEFSKYLIAPCGSFTKIARSEDGRVLYSLHTDESFSLFPRRNFNLALKAFLHCLGTSLGDTVCATRVLFVMIRSTSFAGLRRVLYSLVVSRAVLSLVRPFVGSLFRSFN